MAQAYIGTSGYDYKHWRGPFYPKGVVQKDWFAYYARHLNAVELNVTYYGTPKRSAFEHWADASPEGFRFVLKGNRFITHLRRLAEPEQPVERFFDGCEPLGEKLSAVLWQMPPHFDADPKRLERFTRALAADARAERVRHAFEFRNYSWFSQPIFEVLAEAGAAVVLADWPFQVLGPGMGAKRLGPGRPVVRVPHTADWVYLRRHGPGVRYGSGYTQGMIETDAAWMVRWLDEGFDTCAFVKKGAFDERDREVFAFYNNDAEGYAVRDALLLAELVQRRRLR